LNNYNSWIIPWTKMSFHLISDSEPK